MHPLARPRVSKTTRAASTLLIAGITALVAVGIAGAGALRSAVAPTNSSLPSIGGTAKVGSTVTANPGTWSGSAPISFQYQWSICGADGNACRDIAGQTKQTYHIRTVDPGNTLRVRVTAGNSEGSNSAISPPSPRIVNGDGPANTTPPKISGNVAVGNTLTADPGTWSGTGPVTLKYQWRVCDGNGNACRDIAGATSKTYKLMGADSGNTVRVTVTATDSTGPRSATSVPTPKVANPTSAPTPAPAPAGCPKLAAGAQAVSVNDVGAPARLQIDQFVPSAKPITIGMTSFTVRVHISDTCGQAVSGATVYATGVPYNQVTTPNESTTDGGGWVTLTFNRLSGFPATRTQQLLVMFVRARKAGDPPLGGISTRRLISLHVNLHG